MRAWLLIAVATVASAQERPADHPHRAPLELEAGASHYRFSVPAEAYRGASRRDLGDLRVFNAAGEPVPHAFASPDKPREKENHSERVSLFPLHGDREKAALDSAQVRVQRNAQGTVVNVSITDAVPAERQKLMGYVLDASALKRPYEALVLEWQAAAAFFGRARVEGSEDLRQWHAIAASAPVLSLEHAGARLERNRIELSGARAKYLRVSFEGVPADFQLRETRIELRADKSEPVREWISLPAVPGKGREEFVVDTQARFPVDRLKLVLPQPNTVASVTFYTRDRAEERWRPAGSAIAYRLVRDGGELTNPDIRVGVNPDRYWRLVVDSKGGGFGAGEVKLQLGWLPHEVVFAARGGGPFTLAYGARSPKPGAATLGVVLPQKEELAAARPAKVGAIAGTAPPAASLVNDPVRYVQGLLEHREAKKWLLWASLLAGVLLLGWMALRLLSDVGKTPPDAGKP